MRDPAIKNRMVNKNNGSAERNPNFPAVDADAHKKANSNPIEIFFKEGNKLESFKSHIKNKRDSSN